MKKLSLLLLLLLTLLTLSTVVNVNDTGQSVIGSHEPVRVTAGDDAVLPCHLEPRRNVTTLGVWWYRNETKVHIYRNMADNKDGQDENFKGRTSLFHHEMENGNISLKLRKVTERDAGTYTCYIPKLKTQVKKGNVTLIVGPELDPWRKELIDTDSDTDSDTGNNITIGVVLGGLGGLVVLVIIGVHTKYGEIGMKAICYCRGQRNEEDSLDRNPEAVRLNDMSNTTN